MNKLLLETIKILFKQALLKYLENDAEDFKERTMGERCRVFRVAHYLQNLIDNDYLCKHTDIIVDIEYNRDFYNPKRNSDNDCVTPDLIVHIRNTKNDNRDNNFLVCEFKNEYNATTQKEDKVKIDDYFEKQNYKCGVVIVFNDLNNKYIENIIYYHNKIRRYALDKRRINERNIKIRNRSFKCTPRAERR